MHLIKALCRFLGIDRAVFFSNANQITRLLTGPITIALVLRYLTPERRIAWISGTREMLPNGKIISPLLKAMFPQLNSEKLKGCLGIFPVRLV